MRIVRHLNTEEGVAGTLYAKVILDLPLDNHDRPANQDEELEFRVSTYLRLSQHSKETPEAWQDVFEIANAFLASLSNEDKYAVHNFYLRCKRSIREVTSDNGMIVVSAIAEHLSELVGRYRFAEKLMAFTLGAVVRYPNLEQAGTRPHDRSELTFKLDEYKQLTALSIACKLLLPIWGEFIDRTKDYIDNTHKEIFCFVGIVPLLEDRVFYDVYTKLLNFSANTSMRKLNSRSKSSNDMRDLAFTMAHSGFDPARINHHAYSVLFVKKLATYNPITSPNGHEPPNIMRYIASNLSNTITSIIGQVEKKCRTMVRMDASSPGGDDRDDVSVIENESRISRTTADVPIIIKVAQMATRDRLLKKYSIPDLSFKSALAYYMNNPPEKNVLVESVVSCIAGDYIGGAKGLKMLPMQNYLELIVIAQIHLAITSSPQVAHLLTCTTSAEPRTQTATIVDGRIQFGYDRSAAYHRCRELFPYEFGKGRSIVEHINSLLRWVTEFEHYYNTAPIVSSLMDEIEAPIKRSPLIYDENVIEHICLFIGDHFGSKIGTED